MATNPISLAWTLERRARATVGVAGLDPTSALATREGAERVRGAWVREEHEVAEPTVSVELEAVGLAGAALPQAGALLESLALDVAAEQGYLLQRVQVRFTDLADAPLAPQLPPAPPLPPMETGTPALPPLEPVAPEPLPPETSAPLPISPSPRPATGRRETRVPIGDLRGGRRTVLVISVEVVEEVEEVG